MLKTTMLAFAASTAAAPTDVAVAEFKKFKATFNKSYASGEEEGARYTIFERNMQMVRELNLLERRAQPGLTGDVYGITSFMDLTPSEFAAYKGLRPVEGVTSPPRQSGTTRPRAPQQPSDKLQRTYLVEGGESISFCPSYCTPIKQQGRCGDCWAFAAVEVLESVAMLGGSNTERFSPLSPQQIADCDYSEAGCGGGNFYQAWDFAASHPIETEAAYPINPRSTHSGITGTCAATGSGVLKAGRTTFLASSEQAIANNIQAAPIGISVAAEHWQFYTGGRKAGELNSGQDPGCNPISAATCYGDRVTYAFTWTRHNSHF